MRTALPTFFLLVAAGGLVACGGGGTTGNPGALTCSGDARAMVYTPGMAQVSSEGHLTVKLLGADPAPPVKGNNTWSVEVRDASGPVDGATIAVTPFMPDHGHGSSVRAAVTPSGSPGGYQLAPVNLFMSGLWRVTLAIATPSGQRESVIFQFCVEG